MADIKRGGDPKLAERIIRAIDEFSGKSSREVACEMNVTPQSITRWRKHGYMAKERMPRFCKVCRVGLDWFLTGEGDPRGSNPFEQMSEQDIIQAMLEYLTPAEQRRLLQSLLAQISQDLDAEL